jgi:hypothetical protein
MAGEIYTAPSATFSNVNLNAPGSNYAATYSHDTTKLIEQIFHRLIFDTQPKQFVDLAVLGMKMREQVPSDEFEYAEMGYGRNAIIVGFGGVGTVTYPTTQTVPTLDTSGVSVDTLLNYPNDKKGIVVTVTADTSIVVRPLTNGDTLPTLLADDILTVVSTVEADAADDIKNYSRSTPITRYNYVQMIARAMRFGKMERYKYQNAGMFDNYLNMNRQQFVQQFQEDWSNIFWMGTRGEVLLADGTTYAKTADGVHSMMVRAGSMQTSATASTIGDALEDLAMSTEYGALGDRRMLFATPENILKLYKYYKAELVRYTNPEMTINLDLKMIELPSSQIMLVPMPRFKNTNSFPESWQNKMFLLDMESITPKYAFPDEYGTTQMRGEVGGGLKTYKDEWATTTFSLQYVNPLNGGIITLS